MPVLEIQGLQKEFYVNGSAFHALKEVSLDVPEGMFAVFVGRSGCGKTTLLRIVAGLEKPSAGSVEFRGGGASPKIGMVFQEPRLMPWLTVEENIAFAHRSRERVMLEETLVSLTEKLGLASFRKAYPSQISGGMAQRTALGRTLLYDPDLILMDEPFSALDYFTRAALRDDLLRLYLERKKTVLFVTHDVDEALCLGQRIFVMDGGEVVRTFHVKEGYPRNPPSLDGVKRKILDAIGDGKQETLSV